MAKTGAGSPSVSESGRAGRYAAALIEQAFWSILNFGLNLGLARFASPDQYGAFVFWTNCGFVLVSLQNAVTVTHLAVLAPGAGTDPHRLTPERLMHGVQAIFLIVVASTTLAAALLVKGPLAAPAAALFLPAFLAQQYLRSLAFSRGRPGFAAGQSGALLAISLLLIGGWVLVAHRVPANGALACLALSNILIAAIGAGALFQGQFKGRARLDLRGYGAYAQNAAWVFLGVSTTEVLARFYSFIVAAWYGPTDLAVLSATQILIRPIPLLAMTWGMVARPELVRHSQSSAWRPFFLQLGLALIAGGVIAAGWTLGVAAAWPSLCAAVFSGKYAQFGWMVALWGVSGALNFAQTVLNVGLQALRAFKALALANAAASLVAATAIVLVMKLYGYGGAILGTAAGQLIEVVVMAVLLGTLVKRGAAIV